MATGKIDVDVRVVKDLSKELMTNGENMDQIIAEMLDIEDEIREAWVSSHTEAYIECLEDVRKELTRTNNSVKKVSETLMQTARNIEDTEMRLIQIINLGE